MKKPSTVDVLRYARRIIKERGWAQGALARTRSGLRVVHVDPDASAFCARGALLRAAHETGASRRVVENATDALRDVINGRPIPEWNDNTNRTKDDVITKFGEAIKWVQNEGTRS